MKKTLLFSFFVGCAIIAFFAFTTKEKQDVSPGDELNLGFPEDVHTILETSCFDCHTAESKKNYANKKLNFREWTNYDDVKKIAKLNDICEEITEGKMPTKKYLEQYPNRKLNAEQVTLICKWTEEEGNRLMENK